MSALIAWAIKNGASISALAMSTSGQGLSRGNRLERADFVSEDPSISALVSGWAVAHPMCQLLPRNIV